jgi:5'-methylthioadenosine phosphorylase
MAACIRAFMAAPSGSPQMRQKPLQSVTFSLVYKQATGQSPSVKIASDGATGPGRRGAPLRDKPIPRVDFAVICGSAAWGLRFPEDTEEAGVAVLQDQMTFDTPWGPSSEWKLWELSAAHTPEREARRALSVFSHGWPLDRIDHEAHRRVFSVLQVAGVRCILASSTAGSLNRGILPGDFVIANDILELTQTQHSLLPGKLSFDCSGKQMICPACADVVAATAMPLWPAPSRVYAQSVGLIAGHSWGPRFQTAAEAAAYQRLGADFVNHSLAPEATLAREIGACFVNCTFITVGFSDYFAPPQQPILAGGALDALAPLACRVALRAIAAIPRTRACLCATLRNRQPRHYTDRR